MKNKILYIVAISLAFLSGCQSPEDAELVTGTQGLTRLTAKFTSGDSNGKVATEFAITDMATDTYVIPVPWYFPEESNNETAEYLKAMKVEANLANNYTLTPSLGILDLTKDNYFTLTTPSGEKKQINIRGEAVKLKKSSITFFSVEDEANDLTVSGSIDEAAGIISLITPDDLSSVSVDMSVSPHATFSPNIEGVKFNFNSPVTFTVTAHDGVTSKTYTVKKEIPNKVGYGYAKGSEKALWSKDPVADYGLTWGTGNTTLGAIGNYLVISAGDGTTPIYVNGITGVKIGNITMGSANASGCVTNDSNGNLLIVNSAAAGQTLNIYRTKSVRTAPTLFSSFINNTGYTISRIAVQGNIESDATIVATCEGSSQVVRVDVAGGTIGTPQVVAFTDAGAWGSGSTDTRVVPLSTNKNDGYFLSYYDANKVYHINGQTNVGTEKVADGSGNSWAMNLNRLDVKTFNNARYLALGSISHFPQWGISGIVYMFDATSLSLLTGDVSNSPALVFTQNLPSNSAVDGISANGDVLLAPSSNGFYLYLYYWDNNNKVVGAYSFDCIER